MRRLSTTIAGAGFFLLALLAWARGAGPLTCATRAAVGAAVLFVLTGFCGRIVLRLAAEAVVSTAIRAQDKESDRDAGQ